MKYEIVEMELFGEQFKRMYVREPMTVHEIWEAFHENGMDKNDDEIYYSVGIVGKETGVPLKMI